MNDDYVSDSEPPPLIADQLGKLRELVAVMQRHEGAWGTVYGGVSPNGTPYMPKVEADELAYDAMGWLYASNRVFWFGRAAWDEGREIFAQWTSPARGTVIVESLDHLTTRKLITAIARTDRFCEGAWVGLFDGGFAVPLFERLLEHEEVLARESEH